MDFLLADVTLLHVPESASFDLAGLSSTSGRLRSLSCEPVGEVAEIRHG